MLNLTAFFFFPPSLLNSTYLLNPLLLTRHCVHSQRDRRFCSRWPYASALLPFSPLHHDSVFSSFVLYSPMDFFLYSLLVSFTDIHYLILKMKLSPRFIPWPFSLSQHLSSIVTSILPAPTIILPICSYILD